MWRVPGRVFTVRYLLGNDMDTFKVSVTFSAGQALVKKGRYNLAQTLHFLLNLPVNPNEQIESSWERAWC